MLSIFPALVVIFGTLVIFAVSVVNLCNFCCKCYPPSPFCKTLPPVLCIFPALVVIFATLVVIFATFVVIFAVSVVIRCNLCCNYLAAYAANIRNLFAASVVSTVYNVLWSCIVNCKAVETSASDLYHLIRWGGGGGRGCIKVSFIAEYRKPIPEEANYSCCS